MAGSSGAGGSPHSIGPTSSSKVGRNQTSTLMCPESLYGRVPESSPRSRTEAIVAPKMSTSTPTSRETMNAKVGAQTKIMSSLTQARAAITAKSASRRPSTPSCTDPAVIAR